MKTFKEWYDTKKFHENYHDYEFYVKNCKEKNWTPMSWKDYLEKHRQAYGPWTYEEYLKTFEKPIFGFKQNPMSREEYEKSPMAKHGTSSSPFVPEPRGSKY